MAPEKKLKKKPNTNLVPLTVYARPEEVREIQRRADAANRSLSNFLKHRALTR